MGDGENFFCILFNKEDVSDKERVMAEKYWTIDPDNPKRFLYKVSSIAAGLGVIANKVTIQIKAGFWATGSGSRFFCSVCGVRILIKTRAEYLNTSSKKKCSVCISREKAERLRQDEAAQLEREREWEETQLKKIQAKKDFEEECLQSDYLIEDLSYIEVVFIYLWLLDKSPSEDATEIIFKRTFETITGVVELDEVVLAKLVSKGIVLELNRERMLQLASEGVMEDLDIYYGFCLKKSKEYSSVYEFCSKLYERFCAGRILVSDIDDISSAVDIVRLNNLYDLVHWVEREFRLKVKENTKLNASLVNISSMFALPQCTHILLYNGEKVAAYIHSKKPDYYTIPHLFTNRVDRFLTNVKVNGWTTKGYKQVPECVSTTHFETLICEHYFETEYNWFRLTTEEVVFHWVNSLSVLDDSCSQK